MNKEINLEERQKSCGEEMLINAFNTYYQKVYNFFYGHLYNHEQSQDMAGEVFVRVASAWHRYDPSKAAVSTWIFTIAQNILRDYWRKRKFVLVELEEVQDSCNVAEDAERSEEREALKRALAFLSEKEREVLHLKYYGELKNTEIAELTGLSQSNTAVVVYRALEKLRKNLEEYF